LCGDLHHRFGCFDLCHHLSFDDRLTDADANLNDVDRLVGGPGADGQYVHLPRYIGVPLLPGNVESQQRRARLQRRFERREDLQLIAEMKRDIGIRTRESPHLQRPLGVFTDRDDDRGSEAAGAVVLDADSSRRRSLKAVHSGNRMV
jgi:hypothetical protein